MFHYKEIVSCSAAVLALCVVLSHARPNQNEMLVKSASSLSQDSPSKLPYLGKMKEKRGEIPIEVFYDEPATVKEVNEDHFRQGKGLNLEAASGGVKRRVQRFEKMYKTEDDDATVWTSLTNIVEYEDGENERFKRSTHRRSDEDSSKIFPIRKLKRDDVHVVRIKVRKGGVAIAGPGGIASAGNGGTAIVGPGGSAYTEADGTAVVGPGAKLYQIPDAKSRGRSGFQGYKLIATGPFVFQPPPRNPQQSKAFF